MILFRPNEFFSKEIILTKEEIEHLRSLRLNEIEKEIEVRDGNGNSYFFNVLPKSKIGNLIKIEKNNLNEKKIRIASAIPKANRFDFLIQKSTEIGITDFYFINFFHSDRKEINLERTNKIILEACSQSKRHTIPRVFFYTSLEKFLNEHSNILLLDPKADKGIQENIDWSLIPVIGPEGGFRKEELEQFDKVDAKKYSIGENILRIETAQIFMTSLISFHSTPRNI